MPDIGLDTLSQEEQKIVFDHLQRVFGTDKPGNIHDFLLKAIQQEDTTKLGFLTKEELGNPRHPLRAYKELQVMADTFEMPEFKQYFEDLGNKVVTDPSLSLNGFLLMLAISERRSLQARLPGKAEGKPNRGWFKSRNNNQNSGMEGITF
jgi:hypothetical protein